MTLEELGIFLDKVDRRGRVSQQQRGKPYGVAIKPTEDSKNYLYIVNASAVLEFAGRCNVTREKLRELIRNEKAYAEWETLLYPESTAQVI